MIVFQFVAGSLKGRELRVDRLPVSIGRDSDVDIRVGDDGVFGRHLRIFLDSDARLQLDSQPPAFALIDGAKVQSTCVRVGDCIGVGAAFFRIALDSPKQASLVVRESLLWLGILTLILIQLWAMFELG